jgi:hypothetical protein
MNFTPGNAISSATIQSGDFYGGVPIILSDDDGNAIIDESGTYNVLLGQEYPNVSAGNSPTGTTWRAGGGSNVAWSPGN